MCHFTSYRFQCSSGAVSAMGQLTPWQMGRCCTEHAGSSSTKDWSYEDGYHESLRMLCRASNCVHYCANTSTLAQQVMSEAQLQHDFSQMMCLGLATGSNEKHIEQRVKVLARILILHPHSHCTSRLTTCPIAFFVPSRTTPLQIVKKPDRFGRQRRRACWWSARALTWFSTPRHGKPGAK